MQHPSHDFEGNNQGVLIIDQTTSGKAIAPLPQKYTSVLPAAFKNKELKVPIINNLVQPSSFNAVSEAKKKSGKWLEAEWQV